MPAPSGLRIFAIRWRVKRAKHAGCPQPIGARCRASETSPSASHAATEHGDVIEAQTYRGAAQSIKPGRPPAKASRRSSLDSDWIRPAIGGHDDEEIWMMLELIVVRVHREEDLRPVR